LVVNRLPWDRSYPIGLDTEVFGREALETAWREAKEPHQREHVVPFLYENPARFTMIHLEADGDYGAYRWTVDEPQDLEAVRRIYAGFGGRDDFGWRAVLELMERDPGAVHRRQTLHRWGDRPAAGERAADLARPRRPSRGVDHR
jgi:spore coat polysaccharide biosynthesis protein SpsF